MVTNTSPPSDDGTVLIVDDHELIGASLRMSLRAEGLDAYLCGPSGGAEAVLATAARIGPGVVLLDLDLGRDAAGRRLDGATLVPPLRAAGWRVVILSGTADRARVGAVLDAGADGVVPKRAQLPVLLRAVRDALAGREVMSGAARETFVAAFRERRAQRGELAGKLDRLTPRELEVLELMAQGRSNAAIAAQLVVTERAIAKHTSNIFTKLGLEVSDDDNRRVLAVLAYLDRGAH